MHEIDAMNAILDVYEKATSQTELVSNQGQAMDGYSELANYRAIIKRFIDETTDNTTSK